MKMKLPRVMLWTDKSSMEEFLCEPINKSLYGFYLELRGERWHIGPDDSAVLLFNEIYYQLTKLEYEYRFDYNFNFDDYTQEIEANIAGKEHSIILVFKMLFAFLLLRQNNTVAAKAFQRSIYNHYRGTWDGRTNNAFKAIMQEEEKYSVELRPAPCHAKDLEIVISQWEVITNHFNPSSIREVLNLWSSKEEKITVLHLMERAYKQVSRMPVKVEYTMNYIRAGAYFSNLYSELGGKEGEQKNNSHDSVENTQDNNMTLSDYSFVIKHDLAAIVIEKIRELVKGKIQPKDKMMPIRAAIAAEAIRRPTLNEIKKVFGNDFIGKSSYYNYTNPSQEPYGTDSGFNLLKEEFMKLIS